MVRESFPPERPFGRSEDEHDKVSGYKPLDAGERDPVVPPTDELPRPQTSTDSAPGSDAAA